METTRKELQERQITPLDLTSSAELLNATISDESDKEDAKSKFSSHLRSGYNLENKASISGRVFVLGKDGKENDIIKLDSIFGMKIIIEPNIAGWYLKAKRLDSDPHQKRPTINDYFQGRVV